MNQIVKQINIDEGFMIYKTYNYKDLEVLINTKKKSYNVQFHFNMSGNICFHIIKGTHKLQLQSDESLFYFNPKNLVPIDALIQPEAKMLSLIFSLSALHKIFDNFSIDFNFFKPKNSYKKLYHKKALTPNEIIIINQIYNRKVTSPIDTIYLKAKIMELLTYYFENDNDNTDENQVNLDVSSIEKIKKAKQILIENLNNPPSVEALSNQILLPVNILKSGFKEVYGETIKKYVLNYKLELARQLLLSKKYSVKEISYQMGYSAPTHFIVAFKNKFGVTPKKYTSNI